MTYRRILLIRTGALGDFVATLPVLRALRRAAPAAHIHLLGRPATLVLAGGDADAIDSIDRADWAPFFVRNGGLPPCVASRLKGTDLVLSYLPDADGVFTANLRRAGAQHVVSFSPHPPDAVHIVDHLLRPLAELSVPVPDPVPRVTLTQEDRWAAERVLQNYGLPGDPLVIIHPGSGGKRKCWPPGRFARVADRAAQQADLPVLLLAGPADGSLAERVAACARSSPIVIPPLPLRHLAALLKRAAVYLGNDAGPSHLAAAVGAPTLVLFGPTDPRVWAPRGGSVCVLQGDPGLPPESRLGAISESRVAETLLSHLAASPRGRSP